VIGALAAIVAALVASACACAAYVRLRSDRKALQSAVAAVEDAREHRYNLLEAVPDGVYTLDERLCVTHINEEAERLLQFVPGPYVGRELESMLSPLASDLVPEINRARDAGQTLTRVAHFGAAGWWIEIRIMPAANETVIYLRDITVRKRAESRLLESESRLRMLMEQVPAVLWSVDRSGRFLSLSGAGLAALDLSEADLLGRDWSAFVGGPTPQSLPDEVFAGTPVQFESPSGSRWLRHHVEPLRDLAGMVTGAVGVSLDISELKSTRERLETAARKDALTQLPNRFALEEVLADSLADPESADVSAVLFVDLDRFKTINDTLGHRVGDDVLRVVADRLRSSVDQHDVVARPGGDEFIIVLRAMASLDDVGGVASRLLRRFEEPIYIAGRQLFVRASIGAALAPQHGSTVEELMKNADAAMYSAKRAGRGTFCFYDGEMEASNLERLSLENDLRRAIELREFVLQYQPIVNVASGRILGCEALLRWQHPVRGLLQPDEFIGLAEEAGVIGEITRWVLGEACAFGASVRKDHPQFRVSVNLSASDLHDGNIFGVVQEQLAQAELEPAALEIEVTENALLDDAAIVSLESLRTLGVRIAVDDFGIAYNSLLYLKRLPVTSLKIDRSFVSGVARDAFDQSIVKAIVMLGSSLGLRVIAEGIESEAQWKFVNGLGCEEAQGFCFSRAIDPRDFERLLLSAPDYSNRFGDGCGLSNW
jgi:diguanylate cyclase (GGDEF)-like protein/PAS domain S-box-containing protein